MVADVKRDSKPYSILVPALHFSNISDESVRKNGSCGVSHICMRVEFHQDNGGRQTNFCHSASHACTKESNIDAHPGN